MMKSMNDCPYKTYSTTHTPNLKAFPKTMKIKQRAATHCFIGLYGKDIPRAEITDALAKALL